MKLDKTIYVIIMLLGISVINMLRPSEQCTQASTEREKREKELSFVKSLLLEESLHGQQMPAVLTNHIFSFLRTGLCARQLQSEKPVLDIAINYHGDRIAFLRENSVSFGSTQPHRDTPWQLPSNATAHGPLSLARQLVAIGVAHQDGKYTALLLNGGVFDKYLGILPSPLIGLHILPCERATIGVTQRGDIIAWNNRTGNVIRRVVDGRPVSAAAFALRSGKYVATGHHLSNVLHLWDLASCSLIKKKIEGPWHGTESLAISHDGGTVVASDKHRVLAWYRQSDKTDSFDMPRRTVDGFIQCDNGPNLISHDTRHWYIPHAGWIGVSGSAFCYFTDKDDTIEKVKTARTTFLAHGKTRYYAYEPLIEALRLTTSRARYERAREEIDRKEAIEKKQAQCNCIVS